MINAATEFDQARAASETWDALVAAEVFVEGNFIFANGQHATLKADAEQLYKHPQQLEVVMGHFATYPSVAEADLLVYVPEGMRDFITMLGEQTGKQVANIKRDPLGKSKYDFVPATLLDKERILSAERPLIAEDVVTTLGSVAGVRKLFRPEQTVHSLAILLRGTVDPGYRTRPDGTPNIIDNYLLEKHIPNDKDAFARMLEQEC